MKASALILTGVGVVVAAYILRNRPDLQTVNGNSLEDAADKTSRWGTQQSFTGMGEVAAGKLKQGFGELTGDQRMKGEGFVDQAVGGLKDIAGNAAHAVSDLAR